MLKKIASIFLKGGSKMTPPPGTQRVKRTKVSKCKILKQGPRQHGFSMGSSEPIDFDFPNFYNLSRNSIIYVLYYKVRDK